MNQDGPVGPSAWGTGPPGADSGAQIAWRSARSAGVAPPTLPLRQVVAKGDLAGVPEDRGWDALPGSGVGGGPPVGFEGGSFRGGGSQGSGRRSWHMVLWLVIVVPLLVPVYNRVEPMLFGFPFFYWFQMVFIPIEIGLIAVVYQVTKRRRQP